MTSHTVCPQLYSATLFQSSLTAYTSLTNSISLTNAYYSSTIKSCDFYSWQSWRSALSGQSQTFSFVLKTVPGWHLNCIPSPLTQRQYCNKIICLKKNINVYPSNKGLQLFNRKRSIFKQIVTQTITTKKFEITDPPTRNRFFSILFSLSLFVKTVIGT